MATWVELVEHDTVRTVLTLLLLLFTTLLIRVSICLPAFASKRLRKPKGRGFPGDTNKYVKTLVYFGSGGHTTEMMRLIERLDTRRYQPIVFAMGHTDITSQAKVRAGNLAIEPSARWFRLYRSREVKQSWTTTVFTTAWSCVQALYMVYRQRPQLLICNGPGTCVPLCYSAFLLRVLGLADTVIVFAESYCRTDALSLSGRLVYPIADRFVVHWPALQEAHPRAEYLGQIL